MYSEKIAEKVLNAIAERWGEDAATSDDDCVYIQFIADEIYSIRIDCRHGISHCVVTLPKAAPAPGGQGDLCVYANRLNISLTRDLNVGSSFQVVDGELQLNDIRPFDDTRSIVDLCERQTRDVMSLIRTVTRTLLTARDATEDDISSNAMFI